MIGVAVLFPTKPPLFAVIFMIPDRYRMKTVLA